MKFLLIDCDYIRIKNHEEVEVPVLRLYGIDIDKKESKIVKIHSFNPYFYVNCDKKKAENIINRNSSLDQEKPYFKFEEVNRRHYFGGEEILVTKITSLQPWQVPKIRSIFEMEGLVWYEADIPFNKRFFIDTNLRALKTYEIPDKDNFEVKDLINIKEEELDYDEHTIVMAIDIEVDDQGYSINELLHNKRARITAISCAYGSFENDFESKVFILREDSDNAEKKLITNFLLFFRKVDPTVTVTFNGKSFDWPYLLGRMKNFSIHSGNFSRSKDPIYLEKTPVEYYRIRGRINIDLVPHTWGLHPVSGKKGLDDIAYLLLNENKVSIDESQGELWRSGFIDKSIKKAKKFKKYSIKDAELTYKLYWKLQLPNKIDLLSLSGYPAVEGIHTTGRNIGEFELMRLLVKRNILIPNKPNTKELEERNEYRKLNPHVGGYVIEPSEGIIDQVIICDFLSMYPSLIQAHNIGGEVLKTNAEELSPDQRFFTDEISCLALLEKKLLDKRIEVKKQLVEAIENNLNEREIDQLNKMQKSIKLVANSIYGSHNYVRGRFYSGILSNSITEIGHEYIRKLEKWTTQYGHDSKKYRLKVVYGDTDSVFVKYQNTDIISSLRLNNSQEQKELVKKEILEYVENMNSRMSTSMSLELEDIALRIIFKPGRKKAYSYQSALLDNKVIIKGFEAVRSDWSEFAKIGQKKLLELLLSQKKINLQKAKRFILEYCKNMINISESAFKQKSTIMGNIRRAPRDYKSKTPVVGAFVEYCRVNNLNPNKVYLEYDRFPYVIDVQTSNSKIIADRARHPDYSTRIDRYYYIKEVLAAADRFGVILNVNHVKFFVKDGPLLKYFRK